MPVPSLFRGPARLGAAVALVAAIPLGYVALDAGGRPAGAAAGPAKQVERLDRGLVSVRSGSGNLVSWRLLGTDPSSVAFNVYRGGTRLNGSPITASTNYLDAGAAAASSYTVRPVVNGQEQAASGPSLRFASGYRDVPISPPSGSYAANDASVGDLDGDGDLDFVLKWDPSDSKDNSQAGVTSNVYVDVADPQRLHQLVRHHPRRAPQPALRNPRRNGAPCAHSRSWRRSSWPR